MTTTKAVTRPSRPTIDAVMDNVPPYTGAIAKGGLTNDSRPSVSGRGTAGSIIHVLVDGREIGTAVVAANGTWSFAMSQSLRDGEYRLTARASNDAGMSVPSTSYGIQVDTTPPSQPKIEAATQGTAPQLSGRAEAYSTVTVYDGAKVLGTTTTGIDGTWTFQLPYGLSNGTHAMTVTAMDPAGNTSAASAGYDVVIGPVAPPAPHAQALLDSMGRDSGSFNFDRVTNDGTAGRLLSGHVSAALAAGEKVQVSTDGGRTWQDALTKSDGTWVVIDPNAHTSNWTIQTRVVNSAGIVGGTGVADVTLKTSVAAPTAIFQKNEMVTVKFAGELVQPGSLISVQVGDKRFMHALTAAEISSGSATFAVSTGPVAAAIVDTAGNVSSYLNASGFSENFDSRQSVSISGGQKVSLQYFDLTGIDTIAKTSWKQGLYSGDTSGGGMSMPSPSMSLNLAGKVRLDLRDGLTASHFSFDVGDVTTEERVVLTFYDRNGNLIYTAPDIVAKNGASQHIEIDMPDGLLFSSIVFDQAWRESAAQVLTWLDNFEFAKNTPDQLVDPATAQNLVEGAYHGSNRDTVFTVSNVSYFNQDGSGAHGGKGIDTLKLTGANQVLDITALNSGITNKVTGIEVFDLTGTGNNTLKLSMSDVLTLGHQDLFRADGHTQMMVNGNVGDRVELSGMAGLDAGNWTNQGLAAVNGLAYVVYENAALNVELLVQSSVATQLV
ncbi:Ig-like domain-containing protein [Burkholderia sp. ABCPW 11]|uniref:Ig-like domain-containing protein n=1 Tax=Burkholderia sp. ABCPW 11 TaxID=1637859 RepID=UPI000A52154A|nr:Ig-like domain-containing protein [Burkholderia sp. ABCPW 11]